MISRSTLISALVVVELTIAVAVVHSLTGDFSPRPAGAFGSGSGTGWARGSEGASSSASATPVDRRFATGPAPHVVVDVKDVRVIVAVAAAPSVHVVDRIRKVGYVSGDIPPVHAEQTADGVRITSPGDGGVHVVMGSIEHEVVVTVPATASVEVTSNDRVEARGLRTRFIAHTEDGSIRVRDQRGDLDLQTGDGAIELSDVRAASVTAHTSNGRLTLIGVVADRIEASTDDGRIAATNVRLADGAITTKDGRISVAYTPDSDATLTARTDDGRVEVPAGLHDGSLTDGTDAERHQRVLRLGSGRGRFEISSGGGSINVNQGAQV